MKRAALFLFMVVAASILSGCSLIGLGVGAANPKWEARVVQEEGAPHAEQDGEEVTAVTYQNGYAQIVPVTAPAAGMQTAQVQKVEWIKKSRALEGFGIGLAADVTIALLGVLAYGLAHAPHASSTHHSSGSGDCCSLWPGFNGPGW